jgi:hypothetical protein
LDQNLKVLSGTLELLIASVKNSVDGTEYPGTGSHTHSGISEQSEYGPVHPTWELEEQAVQFRV